MGELFKRNETNKSRTIRNVCLKQALHTTAILRNFEFKFL